MDKSEHLTIHLDRIHSFLISTDDSIIFPSLTMTIEDILVNIAKDTNFLKQSRFGDCRSLAAKLTTVLDKNKDVFTLGHEFKFDDKRKKVMVYKKIPVNAFQEPVSVPSKPLRKPNVNKEKTEGNTCKSVMSSFKITFLNSTLKFVKDDSQMVLSYPNMSSEQADFVKQMIDQCMERDSTKAGFKGLYDPLAEALKIFSLKYDFKLFVGTLGDMKKLRFEKTRKKTDTIKTEGTRIIYEETTDSDCSLKQSGKSKIQKKLTTLIDAITQITPAFKLRTLTNIKDFLKDKITSDHTFSNLSLPEQQFISQWQALTQRVEVMKMFDVQGQMVLDEIRGCLKKKNYSVKVELGMTSSQDRFAKLTKVFNPNNVKLSEEEKIARLKAMVLPTQTRRAALAAENSSSNSSSDTNSKQQNKSDRKVAKFFRKTKGVQNDWIQATLTRLKNFLQDEAEASLIIRSITELQTAFLAKWQNLLSEPDVIRTYPTDVQVLMREVRDVASANKKNFRVEFNLTKFKTGLRDARFAKLPAFYTPPNQIPKENIPVNILPKNQENKTENGTASIKNDSGNKQTTTAVKLDPKKWGKSDKSSEKAVVPTNTKVPEKSEPNHASNKGQVAAQKAAVLKCSPAIKLEPKNGGNRVENNSAPKTTKCPPPENNEAKEISKKVETAAAASKNKKLAAPVKFEPKQSDDKAAKTPANATKARDANELRSGSIANLYRTVCKKLETAENQRKDVPPEPIHKSVSLTSLNQKSRGKKASKVVKLPTATVKLIEALNRPLVSERGMKMMRQMGWEGGPLGVRGEGIAEPLMPELDLGKRAGLGAPKPNIQVLVAASKSTDENDLREGVVNSVDNNFKKDVIQTLLRMVKGYESQKTEMKFDYELTMPDWNYVKEILLIISKYNEEIKIDREQWAYVALAKETLWKRNRRKLAGVSAGRDIDKRVMVAGQAFKYYVMAQLLDFCLNCNAESPLESEITKDIILKGTMVKKQRSYIRDVVTRVNSSARCSSDSVQEVAIHDEIITAMQGKGYKITVDFPPFEDISGMPIYNIIRLTKTYGYRAKTVLIKLPPVKTEATTINNNFCMEENKNIQVYADIIEKNVQELSKIEPKHLTKTTQDTDIANKENNIQTTNIIKEKVKSPVVSEINEIPNDKNVDKTLTNDIKLNCGSKTENTRKDKKIDEDYCNSFAMIKTDKLKDDLGNKHNKTDKKDTGKDNTNQRKITVDEENVCVEYFILEKQIIHTVNDIENTDKLTSIEKNRLNKDKSDKTKGFNDKQNSHSIQSTSTDFESVKDNISKDRYLSTIGNEKIKTNKNDNSSLLLKSIENIAIAKVDITSDNESYKTVETEKTALAAQIKLESIDNISSKIYNATISEESFKTTEEPVVLCQIDKEIERSEVEEKSPPIKDIIASLVELNIADNTESEKVIDIKDVPTTVSSIEVNKENNEKDQTHKRLSKRLSSKAVSSDRAHKRTKYDYVKHINIKPKDYPQTKITNNMAAEIQKSIRQSIDYTQVLPLLKCHGIQDGVLSYSCHNEKSLEIIQNVLKPFDLNVTLTEESEKGTYKMSIKLNTFIDESVESIFDNLETFYLGLSTKDWVLIKKEQYSDFLVIFVDMDLDSYKFIRGENFKLYAGIDEAQFSVVWG